MTVAYDAIGNITGRTNTGITVAGGALNDTYTYGDSSHPYAVTGVTSIPGSYVYDANGNMTSGNGRTITWNDDNLPLSIIAASGDSSTFNYGPDMQRYQQQLAVGGVNTATTSYVGGLFEVITQGSAVQYRHTIMAAGGVVAVHTLDVSGNPTTTYIHPDHLGSSDTFTDETGSLAVYPGTTQAQTMSFDAFGMRRDPTNWQYDLTGTQIGHLKDTTDKGYTSQEQLDNVGLVHMNGRVYDPGIGRMVSADPTVPAPFNSQAFNRYAYVYNRPLRFSDLTGFDPIECSDDQCMKQFGPSPVRPIGTIVVCPNPSDCQPQYGSGSGPAGCIVGQKCTPTPPCTSNCMSGQIGSPPIPFVQPPPDPYASDNARDRREGFDDASPDVTVTNAGPGGYTGLIPAPRRADGPGGHADPRNTGNNPGQPSPAPEGPGPGTFIVGGEKLFGTSFAIAGAAWRVTASLAEAAEETDSTIALVTSIDAFGGQALLGLTVGLGPGLVVGAVIGLGAYGVYELYQHEVAGSSVTNSGVGP